MLFNANCSGWRCKHDSNPSAFSLCLKSSQIICNCGKRINLMNYSQNKCKCSQWVRIIPISMQKDSKSKIYASTIKVTFLPPFIQVLGP